MVTACMYADMLMSFIMGLIWYTIDWREEETSYSYANISHNSSTWAGMTY
jgi:hypothetical protein